MKYIVVQVPDDFPDMQVQMSRLQVFDFIAVSGVELRSRLDAIINLRVEHRGRDWDWEGAIKILTGGGE